MFTRPDLDLLAVYVMSGSKRLRPISLVLAKLGVIAYCWHNLYSNPHSLSPVRHRLQTLCPNMNTASHSYNVLYIYTCTCGATLPS